MSKIIIDGEEYEENQLPFLPLDKIKEIYDCAEICINDDPLFFKEVMNKCKQAMGLCIKSSMKPCQ